MKGVFSKATASVSALLVLAGCDLNNEGVDPPAGQINFPIAVAASAAEAGSPADFLFVVNSDFDLRFNAGTVQAFDLDLVTTQLEAASARPAVLDPRDVTVRAPANSEVAIGAHASGIARSSSGDRLFVAVRSDSNLTYVNVDPETGSLECGGRGTGHRCTDAFRRGDESVASPRNIRLPGDPTGIVAGPLSLFDPGDDATELAGDWVMMSHRGGQASFFLDVALPGSRAAPLLIDASADLGEQLVNLNFEPSTQNAWLLSAGQPLVPRVGVAFDPIRPESSALFEAGTLRVQGVDDGEDVRDIEFGTLANGNPGAYVLARRPEAVLVVDLGRTTVDELFVTRVVDVGFGPSRLTAARFDAVDRTLVFASCYDAREIWAVDPDLGAVVGVVRAMSGPFEMVVDEGRQRLYVADFRASAIRVVDLEPLLDCLATGIETDPVSCEPVVLGSIGEPRPVGDLL